MAIAKPSLPAVRARFPLGLRALALIVVFGGSLLFALSASGKAFNYHEARYAQGAREMLEGGSWLVPTIGKRPRLQKPPIVYWSMAVAMAVFGSEAEWPARLPSVIASLVVALCLADLGARRFGRTFGLVAGLAQVSSVYVLVSGQLADPDMLLAAAVTLGMWSFARVLFDDGSARPRCFAVSFWTAAGIAFLVKGPIGPLLFVPAALLFSTAARRRDVARLFLDPFALASFSILVLGWPLLAYLTHPGILDAWREENVARFRGELGRDSPLFYLYTAPWMALPWTPFALAGAVSLWKQRPRDSLFGLLLAWLVVDFAILSLSAGKHDRYLVPVLPPAALFAARGLLDAAPRVTKWARPATAFATALALEWALAVATQRVVAARFDAYGPYRALAQRLNGEMTPGARLFVAAVPNNVRTQILYYIRRPTEVVEELQLLEQMLATVREAWVLAPASARGALDQLGTVEVVDGLERLLAHQDEPDRLTLLRLRAG
ncbi:MAG TPA: glycosyltransferase family 39 protein [Candidatus Binatia bacterium]|nr:glycosyltransferase family 39 protein [Candidatus Binatia bacterium]